MLSKVLSKETCANCRFCCAFRRSSLWEAPKIPKSVTEKYPEYSKDFTSFGDYSRMMLATKYTSDSIDEEVPCLFLDTQKGCTLSEEDKPFECKIWPLRVMHKDGEIVVALAKTCPAINEVGVEAMKKLLADGLLETIKIEVNKKYFLPEKYRDSYEILENLGEVKKPFLKVYSLSSYVFNDQETFDKYFGMVGDERREKIDKLKQDSDKKMSLAAGVLLKKALAAEGIFDEVTFEYGENGKPGLTEYPDIHFSLSHSHGIAVCALSNVEIGCDVEAVYSPKVDVAKRFFTDRENEQLKVSDNKDFDFFAIWTSKEAVMKLTGKGMRLSLDSFTVKLGDNARCVESQNREILPQDIYLLDVPVKEDYMCTVASGCAFATKEVISYNIAEDELKGFAL